MELYNNNSSYMQDFSNLDPLRVIEKKKVIATKSAKPVADGVGGSQPNLETIKTEIVEDVVQSENTEQTASPENSPQKPECTEGGMNFANRYK